MVLRHIMVRGESIEKKLKTEEQMEIYLEANERMQ